jgi:peptidoglycan/xylan/chitin deacetylase (PgdA/CDA1 family)
MNNTDDNQIIINSNNRRIRINRMKTIIVTLVALFIILPTIGCIILGFQVSKLQKQVNELVSVHGQYGLIDDDSKKDNYVYAAELTTSNKEEAGSVIEKQDTEKQDTVKQDTVKQDTEMLDTEMQDVEMLNADILDTKNLDAEKQFVEKQETELQDTEKLDVEMSKAGQSNAGILDVENLDAEKQVAEKLGVEDQTSNKLVNKVKKKDSDDINSFNKGIYSGKKVYLTFDDGPSIYTDDILDILAEYHVKATFFVIGKEDKSSKDIYKRIVEEGHTLGMHSYSHVYKKIYNSIEDFDKDFTKLWKLLYDTTGYKPSIFRFPGGSDNLVNKNGMEDFIRYLNEGYVTYFDWNVVNGDATGVEYTKEQLIDNVLEGVAIKGTSIVLMHDSQTKETTVASLPELLDVLISEGAEILPIDEDAPPIQMIKAESLK